MSKTYYQGKHAIQTLHNSRLQKYNSLGMLE